MTSDFVLPYHFLISLLIYMLRNRTLALRSKVISSPRQALIAFRLIMYGTRHRDYLDMRIPGVCGPLVVDS